MIDGNAVRAPRGTTLRCRNWQIEAPLRMLMNNLDPDVAEAPEDLVVYGGRGKAARDWESYHAIVRSLEALAEDETLLVQSGRPVGVFRTHAHAPRVLIANSNLVPRWATWEHFRELEDRGLIMFGQMTAGSWIYIGSQGIVQGTYETFAEAGRQAGFENLRGRLVVTAGLGGMGGAQPLAATLNRGVLLAAEVDRSRIEKRMRTRYLDAMTADLDEAIRMAFGAKEKGEPLSVGFEGNADDLLRALVERDLVPDFLTDQTSAHDLRNGYVPSGMSLERALELRRSDPERYDREAYRTVKSHVGSMLALMDRGAVTFDYGNNIRARAQEAGLDRAFDFPGFVPAYIRPQFCEGRGPFRWVALSGDPADIEKTDEVILREFAANDGLCRWIRQARERIAFQGLPARICWLGYGERAHFGRLLNGMVARGELRAPVVIGRDHLDCGSVASPNRETESMADGSDAVADWPLLNALVNTAAGASWVSIHHGGGVGMGYSIHAGMVVVADGTEEMNRRLERVLTTDPGMGVVRHADAGYEAARAFAREHGVRIPLEPSSRGSGAAG